MIIRFPTGLYKTVLPLRPSDGGNVTFTISDNDPPRASLLFPKLPNGIEQRLRPTEPQDPVVQRAALGELVYSVSEASTALAGNNARQLRIGQILEFTDAPTQQLDPMLVPDLTEIQHNSDMLDFAGIGIDDAQVTAVTMAANAAYATLTNQLNDAKRVRADQEQTINTLQKLINDAQRAINALQTVIATSSTVDQSITDTLQLLQRNLARYNTAVATATTTAQAASNQASLILDAIRSLATVIQ